MFIQAFFAYVWTVSIQSWSIGVSGDNTMPIPGKAVDSVGLLFTDIGK